jgi:hypothetical protein
MLWCHLNNPNKRIVKWLSQLNQGKHPHELSEYVFKEPFQWALAQVGAHYILCGFEVKGYFQLTFRESRAKTTSYLLTLKWFRSNLKGHSKSLWAGCVSYRLQPESQAFVFWKISKKPLKTTPYLNSVITSRRPFCLSRRRIIRLSTAPSTVSCKYITNT